MNIDTEFNILNSFGSAIVGGLIAAGASFLANWQAYQNNLKFDEIQSQKKIDGILQSIRCELEILGAVYMQQAGGQLANLNEGETFDVHFSLTEKYFIVYPNNTDVVGQIEDTELVKSIIVTYNMANFLIEMFRINNWYMDRLRESQAAQIEGMGMSSMADNIKASEINTLQKLRVQHAAMLKRLDKELDRQTKSLLVKIDSYRIITTVKS